MLFEVGELPRPDFPQFSLRRRLENASNKSLSLAFWRCTLDQGINREIIQFYPPSGYSAGGDSLAVCLPTRRATYRWVFEN